MAKDRQHQPAMRRCSIGPWVGLKPVKVRHDALRSVTTAETFSRRPAQPAAILSREGLTVGADPCVPSTVIAITRLSFISFAQSKPWNLNVKIRRSQVITFVQKMRPMSAFLWSLKTEAV